MSKLAVTPAVFPVLDDTATRPRRFCMVTTFFPPYNFGGDGIFVYRLANALARRGHEVHVVHDIDAFAMFANQPQDVRYPLHANVVLHPLELSRAGALDLLLSHQAGRPFGKQRALKSILGRNFDVIHFHNISLLGGPHILTYGDGLKLCTTHDHWFVCAMHVLWRFNRAPCSQRTCLACTLHGRRPPQLWRYNGALRRTVSQVDAFIAPSQFVHASHERNGFPADMQVIPYFMPEHEPAETALVDEPIWPRPYFLFVGRLEKIKGLHSLILAFRDYDAADLLIAGAGTYEPALRTLATSLAHVHFLGFQDHEQLHRLYAGAIAVVVPSICFETFGWPVLEAFAAHTPVIVHDLGALPEVAAGGGGFSYRSLVDLTEAMERLRCDLALREQMGARGYESFRANFSEERHLAMYFDLITRLEEQRSRS